MTRVLLLKSGLIDRSEVIEQSDSFLLCTFMDPGSKCKDFPIKMKHRKQKKKLEKWLQKKSTVTSVTNDDKRNDELSPWNIIDLMIASTTTQGTPLSKAIKEVDMYLSDELRV
ncbi:unnamed protein product, partial [Brenthis ino]